jgi:hypothetical protein
VQFRILDVALRGLEARMAHLLLKGPVGHLAVVVGGMGASHVVEPIQVAGVGVLVVRVAGLLQTGQVDPTAFWIRANSVHSVHSWWFQGKTRGSDRGKARSKSPAAPR